jgi:ABC-type amino acid transport substrate-binding protein
MRAPYAMLPALAAAALFACAPAGPPDDDAAAGRAPARGETTLHGDRGDTWRDVERNGRGTIQVLYVPSAGWAYRGDDGSLTGVTVEIMRAFAAWVRTTHDVDLDLHFVDEPDWGAFYRRVRDGSGGVFGLGNVTITEARRAELRFSPPYVTNVAVLITHAAVPDLTRLSDAGSTFRGLHALAFEGTLHEARLRALRDDHAPATQIELASTNDEIIRRVSAGGYFAYVDGYNFWRAQAEGAPLKRHAAGDDPAEEFGIIMPLDSDWSPLLEAFFAHDGGYRDTGAYRALLVEHLGAAVAEALDAARRSGGSAS